MGNKFYDPGVGRAEKVGDLFAAIAPRYDLINDLQSFGLHRMWKRRVVKLAGVRAGEKALDLCCGTGDVALALADRGLEVVGLDFSEAMLRVAETRLRNLRGSKEDAGGSVVFLRGDAMRVPFPDRSFDLVTISYGLRNLRDWRGGLEEMIRLTRPGGRLLILDFGKPELALWRWIYFVYLRLVVPVFGKLFCGDSSTHAYILESLKHYPAQKGVADALRELSCAEVEVHQLWGGMMSIHRARV